MRPNRTIRVLDYLGRPRDVPIGSLPHFCNDEEPRDMLGRLLAVLADTGALTDAQVCDIVGVVIDAGLPDREGYWWYFLSGAWWNTFVHDPTGDGLQVAGGPKVAEFKVDRWGPRAPAPDESIG